MILPKILVCAPTAVAKDYCFEEWLDNVMGFTYPFFDVKLFDNTLDNGIFTKRMNDYYKSNYGNNDKFSAFNSFIKNSTNSVIERMCVSHNWCSTICLDGGYDYILHLETDVFPPKDIIEHLLFHKKNVVGGVYYRDEGMFRKPMLQRHIYRAPNNIVAENFTHTDDIYFIDGGLKKVASVGLGCVLINRTVLQRIKFRFEPNKDMHPDTFFSEDCFRLNIPIYADTFVICRHDNKPWGIYGKNYN